VTGLIRVSLDIVVLLALLAVAGVGGFITGYVRGFVSGRDG
jgi:hypothetical protein